MAETECIFPFFCQMEDMGAPVVRVLLLYQEPVLYQLIYGPLVCPASMRSACESSPGAHPGCLPTYRIK